nr:TPA_asm: integrase [Ladona dragonfly adintovirus]
MAISSKKNFHSRRIGIKNERFSNRKTSERRNRQNAQYSQHQNSSEASDKKTNTVVSIPRNNKNSEKHSETSEKRKNAMASIPREVKDDNMRSIYYNISHPASLSSVRKLSKAANTNLKTTGEWLSGQDAHTLHKPMRRRIPRNRYATTSIDETWQCDLNDMRNLKKFNKGYQYLLTVIDVFSKFAWAIPLKSKSSDNVIEAFKKILKTRKPLKVQSDKGTEFSNRKFKKFLDDRGIKFYTTNNPDIKASIVERFNRTLKTKMYKYFTFANTFTYIDVLQKLLKSYNDSVHSSTGIQPSKVTIANSFRVAKKLSFTKKKNTKFQYTVGDFVRISKERLPFQKGYTKNFSEEIFRVNSRRMGNAMPTYRLEDLNGDVIKGSFYEPELVRVKLPQMFTVEKILRRRGKGRNLEYFVKWLGYDENFNSWVRAASVRRL